MDCFCVGNEQYQPCSIIRKLKLREVEKFVQDYTTKNGEREKRKKRERETEISALAVAQLVGASSHRP